MPTEQTIAVLGAGPAGLALASRLLRQKVPGRRVVVVEKAPRVGGLAASFEHEGLYFDLGSHRLHPTIRPDLLADLQALPGLDLLERPRTSRIHLQGRFIRFPLRPAEMLLRLPWRFSAGVLRDILTAFARTAPAANATFAERLRAGLGTTICEAFYFPFAQKLWGLPPEELDGLQVRRRIAADTLGKILKRVLLPRRLRGAKPAIFYYPRKGFGAISTALAQDVLAHGGEILLEHELTELALRPGGGWEVRLRIAPGDSLSTLHADKVFSTIPLTVLCRALGGLVPEPVQQTVKGLRFRATVLVYLVLNRPRLTPHDTHFFPAAEVPFSRISEPRNFSGVAEPPDHTGLCAELPCDLNDATWNANDAVLTARVVEGLRQVDLPVDGALRGSFVRRVPFVYPVYSVGVEGRLQHVTDFLDAQPGLVNLGRQGLFLHDNTHHTMALAYSAADCLTMQGHFNTAAWQQCRQQAAEDVVED